MGAGIAEVFAKANANIAGCALEPPDHEYVQAFVEMVEEESGDATLVSELAFSGWARLFN